MRKRRVPRRILPYGPFVSCRVVLWCVCLVLVTAAGGCAINPVSGRPEMAVISGEKERELGAEAALKVEASIGLVTDPVPLAYVQAVGGRVAKHSPRQNVSYTFQIVNQPLPNAFALSNGNIYISRGLLALANSEDELAGVLGHEVVHVAARHTVRNANMAVATSPLRIAAGIAGAAAGMIAPRVGEGVAGLGEVATAALLAPYGRSQEREADDVGVDLVARAGYDPKGLRFILQTMEQDEALRKDGPPHQKPLQVAGTINAYAAMMAERAGFRALYLSGAGVANASFGLPNLGMTTLTDVLEEVENMQSRAEFYDFLGYHDYEAKLDELFGKEEDP